MPRALLALALCLVPLSARAQPRPEVFYILTRAAPPRVEASRLPVPARAPYLRTIELADTIRAIARLPRSEVRNERLARVDAASAEAWAAVEQALHRERARLDGAGWRVLGEARIERALRSYLTVLEAYDADPEGTPMPEHADLAAAIDALRHASALERDDEAAAWSRYLEAWCLLEMGDRAQAAPALRIVAASGPAALRGEARFRLADLLYEDQPPSFGEAAGWYERAAQDARPEQRPLVIYKLAWARYHAGDRAGTLAAIERLPDDAPEGMQADLAQLRELAVALP